MGWFSNGQCLSNAKLDGKTAIITGASSGIGKVTALDFAKRGARVIMACRDLEKAERVAQEIEKELKDVENAGVLIIKKLDLASFESIRKFSKEIIDTEPYVHLLINNGGIMMCPRSLSEDGFELQFATNYLGHFLLTMLILPVILKSPPARIVNVSSKLHMLCRSMRFEDINLENNYSPVLAYARSKLASILFTKELARKLQGKGVNVYSVHPGAVYTDLYRHADYNAFIGFSFLRQNLFWYFMKDENQGAQTTIYCALDEKTAWETGLYYDDCEAVSPSELASDEYLATELWDNSVGYVKLGSDDPFILFDTPISTIFNPQSM